MASRPRKFEPGPPFADPAEVAKWCDRGDYVFAFGPRPLHGSIIMNQQLRTVVNLIRAGRLRRANIRHEWHEWAMGRPAA